MSQEANISINSIEKNIWSIRSYFKEIFIDSYIILKDSIIIIIDSGLKSSFNGFKEVLDKVKFNKIFLISTHSHWDHIGSSMDIKNQYGAFLLGHIDGEKYFNNPAQQWAEIFNNTYNILKPNDLDREVFFKEIPEKIIQDMLINDDEILIIGDNQFKFLHTPGHSKCSACLYDEKNQYLYSGDLLSGSGINGGIVIINSYLDYIDSINKVKNMKLKKIFTSHKSIIEEDQISDFLRECLFILKNYKEILIKIIKKIKKSDYKGLIEKFSLVTKKKKSIFLEITLRSLLKHLLEEQIITLNNNYYIFTA